MMNRPRKPFPSLCAYLAPCTLLLSLFGCDESDVSSVKTEASIGYHRDGGVWYSGATLSIDPTIQRFEDTRPGMSSTAAKFIVTNVGLAPTSPLTVALAGADHLDFQITKNRCATPLPGSAVCEIEVIFLPITSGQKLAQLVVTAVDGGTQTVLLNGRANLSTRLSITPSLQDFSSIAVGVTTNPTVYPVAAFTVKNSGGLGTIPLTVEVAGTEAADFAMVTNDCSAPLAPEASCIITLRFRPTAAGARNASLNVSAGVDGNVKAALAGTGITLGAINVAPLKGDFSTVKVGDKPLAVFILTNTGGLSTGPVMVTMAGTNASEFAALATCPAEGLIQNASCTIAVTLNTALPGAKSAELLIATSPGGMISVPLTATITSAATNITMKPAIAASTDPVTIGQNTVLVYIVRNEGISAAGKISASVASGSADFKIESNMCGENLDAGRECIITVIFAPTLAGVRKGTLLVTTGAGAFAATELAGSAVGTATLSSLSVTPNAHAFAATVVGTSLERLFVLKNTGTVATGTLTASLSGISAADFAISTNTCTAVLQPAEECLISINFTPKSAGSKNIQLLVSTNPGGYLMVDISGTSPGSALEIRPGWADYGTKRANSGNETRTFTVENTADIVIGPLTVALEGETSAFTIVSNSCAQVTEFGREDQCQVKVKFAPLSTGFKQATLSVSAALVSTVKTSLQGTGN